jgi:hypothetical protein
MYLDMLEEFLIPILEEGPDDMLLQRDGAHPNFHSEVTDVLYRKFPEKWTGRGGPIAWPRRPLNLTTCVTSGTVSEFSDSVNQDN